MSNNLSYVYGDKNIMELRMLQEQGHLNLEPGFQRKSVWTASDRQKLIQSLLDGYPIPSIFLYRREDNGMPIYDVLDGKQRLETIFMFSKIKGFKRSGFDVKYQFPEDDKPFLYGWKDLERWGKNGKFLTYSIQTVEVSGEFSDIVELFVRINSTGKALSPSERRHAKYYTSPFLMQAQRLAAKQAAFFINQQILGKTQIGRMKDVELVSELLASLLAGGPINRKQAVDRAVGNQALHAKTLGKVVNEATAVFRLIARMFPDLRSTRFSNSSEFYTLFLIVWELRQQHMILTDRRRNRQAMELLRSFSDGVDRVRELQKRAKGARPEERMFANYLLQVQQQTDDLTHRKNRADMVRQLFKGLFARKDAQRIFSAEQRRLLWNTDDKKTCSQCGELLNWNNFQVDHIKPYSRGGRTRLSNAALICRHCNASKGAGRKNRRRKKAA